MALFLSSCSSFFVGDQEFQERIGKIKEQNDILRKDVEEKKSNFEYFSSVEYKDKYAKMHLDKINPGEQVLIVTFDNEVDRIVEEENPELFETNDQSFAVIQNQVLSKLEELGLHQIDDRYKPEIREYQVFTKEKQWIWFNLMTSIEQQLKKLEVALKDKDFVVLEYIDLRIPDKVIYK